MIRLSKKYIPKEYLNMTKEYIVDEIERLDKFISNKLQENRNQIELLIKKGFVKIDNKVVNKSGQKLKLNQKIEIDIPQTQTNKSAFCSEEILKYDIEIIYEDDALIIINKPAGLIVHDAPSVSEPTLVDWLKLKKISLSTISGEERHGIVHRLDKGTSGLLVVAKTNEAHVALSRQLEDKTMGRYYLAVIDIPLKEDIIVQKHISRNLNHRLKMGINNNGKFAKTAFKKLIENKNNENNSNKYELICTKLFTGRTHQIRVHLESLNRHILGDDLYGFKGKEGSIQRIYLHAYTLYLKHPVTNEDCEFVADIPSDMQNLLKLNFDEGTLNEKINKKYIVGCFDDVDKWL